MQKTLSHSLLLACAGALASAMLFGCGGDDSAVAGTVLSNVSDIAPGDAICPAGGQRIDSGIDKNSDGELSADEIAVTSYACNGGNTSGSLIIQKIDESAGANCAAGGVKVISGFDTDGDGALTGAEILNTSYVCNAEESLLTLSTDEPAGANCEFGGIRLDMGSDADGDGLLSADEITSTAYTCFEENDANALNASAYIASLDNTLIRIYASINIWSQKLSATYEEPWRQQVATSSYLDYLTSMYCASTDDYVDMTMTASGLHSSALTTSALVAQEIREGRLVFDAAAFNRDFAFMNDSFTLCSGAAFEEILKITEISPWRLILAPNEYVMSSPSYLLEQLTAALAKNYLHGNVSDGNACYFDSECLNSNSACRSNYSSPYALDVIPGLIDPEMPTCSIGICMPLKAAGEACSSNSECKDNWCYHSDESGTGTCTVETETYTVGDACGYVSAGHYVQCGNGYGNDDYYCEYDNDGHGTCAYAGDFPGTVGLGEDCSDYICDSGLFCKTTYDAAGEYEGEVCVNKLANGETCVSGDECLGGNCYKTGGANEGICEEYVYVELGEACGLVGVSKYAICDDGVSVCLYSNGELADADSVPTEKGQCILRGNVGRAVGEKCSASEECLDSWSGITACLGPDRTALASNVTKAAAEGTCQYVGDIGDKCSNSADPNQIVCKRPLECNNTTGLCQELPSAGSPASENYPYCNPLDSISSDSGFVILAQIDAAAAVAEPPVCLPLLDVGEATDPESSLPSSMQCKSHYALNGICIDNISFYEMLENTSSEGGPKMLVSDSISTPCDLEYVFHPSHLMIKAAE